MMKLYYEYASKVLNNEIVTGDTIKLACKRFQNDLLRDDLEFREDVVDRAISFIGTLKHYTGKHAGSNFILEGWQQFIIANILGFYWKGTGTRRFTSSYIETSFGLSVRSPDWRGSPMSPVAPPTKAIG